MYKFDNDMNDWMVKWRKKHITDKRHGYQNGKKRPWILPIELWEEGLWEDIRSNSDNSLQEYLDETDVNKHGGSHNLKSSWVLCANLYFPFRQGLSLLTTFLRSVISPKIKSVDAIELEYAEKGQLAPSALLGEPEGQRGRNQTSPDVAFKVTMEDGKKGIILIENKFTEHSFYGCSGRKKKYGNPDIKRCLNFGNIYKNTRSACYQLSWKADGRENRKYWDFIKISAYGQSVLMYCPAAVAGYQLFRQQALAEGYLQKGNYDYIASCVAYDGRNETLKRCLRTTGIDDFTTGWGKIFNGKVEFKSFMHQQWVTWVRKNNTPGRWGDWAKYIEERYGI